jgi:GNAT superfamily N-acetyltransferase
VVDDRALLEAMWSNTGLVRGLAAGGSGARLFERDGVVASIVPASPERSVVNSLFYADAAGLAVAYGDLASSYEEAGVRAWTVWVPEDDREAATFLAERGHVLDAAPDAMGTALEAVPAPVAGQPADWSRAADPPLIGALNDRAYGYDGSFERALRGFPVEAAYWYVARVDGEPASCLMVLDHDSDAEVNLVATVPQARGRGLAGALMAHALADARERGCASTTLVATRLGRPVYERLGYRALGRVQMWERRREN